MAKAKFVVKRKKAPPGKRPTPAPPPTPTGPAYLLQMQRVGGHNLWNDWSADGEPTRFSDSMKALAVLNRLAANDQGRLNWRVIRLVDEVVR